MQLAIKWIAEAWRELKISTIVNCWNKVRILPAGSAQAFNPRPDIDTTLDELADLLKSFATART